MTAPLRVLVTRARPQAEATAARLRALGMEPLVAPLLEIGFGDTPIAPMLAGVQALLVTSANGIAALLAQGIGGDRPLLAVGDRTAQRAREAGFTQVRSAAGTAADLATLAAEILAPADGTVLHVRGEASAHSPLPALRAAGFATSEVIAYRTRYRDIFPPAAAEALSAGHVDAALVYSPKAARALLASHAKLPPLPRMPALIAISPAAAAPLHESGRFPRIDAAETPTEDAMLQILGTLAKNSVAGTPQAG